MSDKKWNDLIAIWQNVYADQLKYTHNPSSATEVANRAITTLAKVQKDDDLLDHFAGQALAGMASDDYYRQTVHDVAEIAYRQAEAMIAEKAKREASHE